MDERPVGGSHKPETRIALVTDSSSTLLPSRDLGIVSLSLTIDGRALEEDQLEIEEFYRHLIAGTPMSTSQPSPGRFLESYRAMAEAGANAVFSIHIAGSLSGTVNSARLAAEDSPIPVQIFDSGTASFPLGLCVRSVQAALRADPTSNIAATVTAALAAQANFFLVLSANSLRRSGRSSGPISTDQLPLLALTDGRIEVIGSAPDAAAALRLLAARIDELPAARLAAVGDAALPRLAAELEAMIRERRPDLPVERYRVPASVAVHTGPTIGVVLSTDAVTSLPG